MIKLDIQDYCHDCLEFEADVERGQKCLMYSMADTMVHQTDTIVRCKHRNRCKAIKRYLEKEAQNAENCGDQLRIQGVSGGE